MRWNILQQGWHFIEQWLSKAAGSFNLFRLGHLLHSLYLCGRRSHAFKVRFLMGTRHFNSFKIYIESIYLSLIERYQQQQGKTAKTRKRKILAKLKKIKKE